MQFSLIADALFHYIIIKIWIVEYYSRLFVCRISLIFLHIFARKNKAKKND